MTPDRIIEITEEPFGCGFDVKVTPSIEGDTFDREFPTYKAARGWAGGLRLTYRWKIIDHTGGGNG